LLGNEPLAAGDIILTEVLQGFGSDRDFEQAKELFEPLTLIDLGGKQVAIEAARNFRTLRASGITVRKTVDTMRCIQDRLALLYSDRDFDPFVKHLGLRPALAGA
jgi:hypothetical protein